MFLSSEIYIDFSLYFTENTLNKDGKVSLISLYSQNILKGLLSWCLIQIPAFIIVPSLVSTHQDLYHSKAIFVLSTSLIFLIFLVCQSLNKTWNHSLVKCKLEGPSYTGYSLNNPRCADTHIFFSWEFLYPKRVI